MQRISRVSRSVILSVSFSLFSLSELQQVLHYVRNELCADSFSFRLSMRLNQFYIRTMGNCIAIKKKNNEQAAGQLYLDTVQQQLNKKRQLEDMSGVVETTPQPLQQTQGIIIRIPESTFNKITTKNFAYEGNIMNELLCGNGKITFPSGVEYEGKFFDGRANGEGRYTDPATGITYCGIWRDGFLEDHVEEKIGDKVIFQGEYKGNKRNGKGRFMSGGVVYQGEFMDGMFHGYGKATWADCGYEGEWVKGLRSGKGKGYGPDWNYQGDWYAGRMDGYGRMVRDRVEMLGYWDNGNYIGRNELDD